MPLDEVLQSLSVSVGVGLGRDEAARRLDRYGRNSLPAPKRRGPLLRFALAGRPWSRRRTPRCKIWPAAHCCATTRTSGRTRRLVGESSATPPRALCSRSRARPGSTRRRSSLPHREFDEIPFESEHRYMATLHHDHGGTPSCRSKARRSRCSIYACGIPVTGLSIARHGRGAWMRPRAPDSAC